MYSLSPLRQIKGFAKCLVLIKLCLIFAPLTFYIFLVDFSLFEKLNHFPLRTHVYFYTVLFLRSIIGIVTSTTKILISCILCIFLCNLLFHIYSLRALKEWIRLVPTIPPKGSSPHMRDKSIPFVLFTLAVRITPAYTGQIHGLTSMEDGMWDHPRIRGTNFLPLWGGGCFLGSSPHTRDKFHVALCVELFPGIIPAYAGQIGY